MEKSARKTLHCQRCPATRLSRSDLQTHIRLAHENLKNYPCSICRFRFGSAGGLRRHVEARHPAGREKMYSCDKCRYRSYLKTYLDAHRRRHQAGRHACYFCGKKFVTFYELVNHCSRHHTLEK